MQFQKIKVAEKVELVWTSSRGSDVVTHGLTSSDTPASDLPKALQAFAGYAIDLLELNPDWFDELRVTSVHLDEGGDSGLRGLIVTAVRPVEKANGRPLVVNTPRMRESEDGDGADDHGCLSAATIALIANAEKAATAFVKGEREQLALPIDGTDTAGEPANEAAEAVRNGAKKTGRRKKEAPRETESGIVQNPDKTEPPTDERLRAVLLNHGYDVPLDAIAHFTSRERDAAFGWAARYSGQEAPDHVRRAATGALWDEKAPTPSDDAAQTIKAAAEAGD